MRNVAEKNCRESKNTHIVQQICFRNSYRLWDNVAKYGRARTENTQFSCRI